MTTFTYPEALAESIKYFKGDELAASVWINKYAMKDSYGSRSGRKENAPTNRTTPKRIAPIPPETIQINFWWKVSFSFSV